ncbi:MAG: hypothetical protein D6753_11850 [Planctomycetota bacterium]|nr:MAG: hypothetical protein D6753_11850 [Planctomycetota bacterium]
MASDRLDRRALLRTAAASGACAAVPCPAPQVSGNAAIVQENQREGTTDWQLTRVRINRGTYRTSLIEGYCSHQSIAAGETLQVFVSTDPASTYRLEIFRMGYYGGLGARQVAEFGPLQGIPQPVPEIGPRRIRQCRWEPALEVRIPSEWLSGVYLGKLTTVPVGDRPYWQSYIVFIVRDQRQADILFQCSDNTWQAYNRWPENESLYTHPGGAHFPGVAVSFDRPYGKYCQILDAPLSVGSGEFLLWEYPLCFWLEQHGYDVTYCSNSDVLDADAVTRARAFISVGHDEYWDLRQYRAVESAIARGTNILWLSGNSVYMVSPLEAAPDGRPGRILSRAGCYGALRSEESQAYHQIFGPLQSAGPDERRIIGARTVVPFNGGGDWICTRPEHWAFANTGMRAGDAIPGLVGWEYHGDPDVHRPGLEVLGQGTAWAGGERPGRWAATIFPGGDQNFVFNASTVWWTQGLASPPGHMLPWSHFSRPHGPDPRVQQITHNLLKRALATGRTIR